VEWQAVKALTEAGMLVIAAGGGGIPVVRDADERLHGVEAVIDKDLAAQRLASLVGARTLALLTEVEAVAVDFGTPQQRPLGTVSLKEMKRYYAAGQFPPGSMGPKVQAAIEFLEEGGERAVITSTQKLAAAVGTQKGMPQQVGTQIVAQKASRAVAGARQERPA
jgi:carbamate kinase